MNLLVCIKQVPNTEELKIDAAANTSNLDSLAKIVSTFDAYALETAVRLKDADPSVKVTVVTKGSAKAKDALITCLSVGADTAYHVCDDAFNGTDSLAAAHILSLAVREIEKRNGTGFDIIFCGRQALDSDSGHVGPQLAEFLNIPQLTYAREVTLADGKVRANRETEDGVVVMDATLPALVTVTKTEYEPRFASVKSKMAAKRATIDVLTAADIGFTAEVKSAAKVGDTVIPQRKTGGVRIEEETGELAANKLSSLLSDAGII